MFLSESIEQFKNYLISELNASPNTVDSYIRDVKQFINYIKIQLVSDLKNAQIVDFLQNLQMSEKTIARKSASLMHFFKFLYRDGLIDFLPEQKWKAKLIKKTIPKFISHTQIIKMIGFYREDDLRKSLILALLYTTGVRVSELIAIKKKIFFSTKSVIFIFCEFLARAVKKELFQCTILQWRLYANF